MYSTSLFRRTILLFAIIWTAMIELVTSSTLVVMDDTEANQIIGNVLPVGYIESKYSGDVGSVSYTLMRSHISPASYFRVTRATGKLSTRKRVDRDIICRDQFVNECRVTLKVALLMAGSSEPTLIDVHIDIIDRNDHQPKFSAAQQIIKIKESAKLNSLYRLHLAHDNDSPKYAIETYLFEPPLPPDFALKMERKMRDAQLVISAVYLELKERLDRERIDHYLFTLKAIDGGAPRQTGSTIIRVEILDDNDNGPVFANTTYRVKIKESLWTKNSLLRLKATDKDIGENAKIKYLFSSTVDKSVVETFSLDETTGNLYMKRALDYETTPQYLFEVVASDVLGHPRSSTASVVIDVVDLNDEIPAVFIDYINTDPDTGLKRDYAEVQENWTIPKFIAHLLVTDKDTGDKGHVNCRLDNRISDFVIKERKRVDHEVEYSIYTAKSLDHEIQSEIHLAVWCSDKGVHPRTTKVMLRIRVTDVNDHAPKLTLIGRPEIRENRPQGTHVLKVNATDPDAGVNGQVTFSMTSTQLDANRKFRIDPLTGDIVTMVILDREEIDPPIAKYPIIVTAYDGGNPRRSSSISFDILVVDENDNPPTFKHNPMEFSVRENRPGGEQIGEIVITDKDSSGTVTLRMTRQGGRPFVITNFQGKFYLNTTRPLDRENIDKYIIIVTATDFAGRKSHTATGTIIVTVEDENDNAPTIIFPQTPNKTFPLSYKESRYYELLTVNANDKDMKEGGGHYYFQLSAAVDFLDIDPSSGTIRVHRDMTKADMGPHVITVIVCDSGQQQRKTSTQLIIIVDDSPPHPSSEFEGKFIDAKPSDWSNDMVLIVILVTVLLLLLGTLTLFIYVRHWRNPGDLLPDFISFCTGGRSGSRRRYQKRDGLGGDHPRGSVSRADKEDESSLSLGATLNRPLCKGDIQSSQIFLAKCHRPLPSALTGDHYRTIDYDTVEMTADNRLKARVYHEHELEAPCGTLTLAETNRPYEFLIPSGEQRRGGAVPPHRLESLQSTTYSDKSYQTLGPFIPVTDMPGRAGSPHRKNSLGGWIGRAPQTPKLPGSDRRQGFEHVISPPPPRYNSESNLALGTERGDDKAKDGVSGGGKGERYENFVVTDQYKKQQRSMYMCTKSFPHTQASYV